MIDAQRRHNRQVGVAVVVLMPEFHPGFRIRLRFLHDGCLRGRSQRRRTAQRTRQKITT